MSNEQDSKNQDAKTTQNEPQLSDELASEELDQVVGGTDPSSGKVHVSEITITKTTDSSSSSLFIAP